MDWQFDYPCLICGGAGIAFWLFAWPFQLVLRKMGVRELREKGILIPPSNLGWVPLFKSQQHVSFQSSGLRFSHVVVRFCMWGMVLSFGLGIVLISLFLILKLVNME